MLIKFDANGDGIAQTAEIKVWFTISEKKLQQLCSNAHSVTTHSVATHSVATRTL